MQHGLAGDGAHVLRLRKLGVLVHQMGEKLLVERAPVCADSDRLAVLDGLFDDRRELDVALGLEAHVARIDPVFVERLGTGGVIGQELMADIVKIADQRHEASDAGEPLLDLRHGGGGFVTVDGDTHHFGASAGERCDLAYRRIDISCIGVGHRLDDDGRASAHGHGAFALTDDDGQRSYGVPGDQRSARRSGRSEGTNGSSGPCGMRRQPRWAASVRSARAAARIGSRC